MRPNTVSASSLKSFLGCERRYVAETEHRLRIDSEPGRFGTTLHSTLDRYIETQYGIVEGTEVHAWHDPELLLDLWHVEANAQLDFGSDYIEEGAELLRRWANTRPLPHRVIQREEKKTFDLPVGEDVQKVTYIIDRLDQHEDGAIEVIDYKSQYLRVNGDAMRKMMQPALYASAVRREFGVDEVIVTYDLLRYEPVSIILGKRDIDAFDAYLTSVVERIHALQPENAKEKLNGECRYCPLKSSCSTLRSAVSIGWTPTMPAQELAAIHEDLKNAKKGIEALLEEVDAALLADVQRSEHGVADVGDFVLGMGAKPTTKYDPEVLLRTVGPEAVKYMSVGKTALDKELNRKRNNIFSEDEIAAIKAAAVTTYGQPYVTVTPKNPMDVE
jgi:RecB family exonuclease